MSQYFACAKFCVRRVVFLQTVSTNTTKVHAMNIWPQHWWKHSLRSTSLPRFQRLWVNAWILLLLDCIDWSPRAPFCFVRAIATSPFFESRKVEDLERKTLNPSILAVKIFEEKCGNFATIPHLHDKHRWTLIHVWKCMWNSCPQLFVVARLVQHL